MSVVLDEIFFTTNVPRGGVSKQREKDKEVKVVYNLYRRDGEAQKTFSNSQ